MVNPSTTRTTRSKKHQPTRTSVPLAPPHDHERQSTGRLHLGEPVYVEMTEEERRRAIAALGTLLGWAVAHPECWRESAE
jgi:hypothetical protein